jgi:chromosome segregation ATPase
MEALKSDTDKSRPEIARLEKELAAANATVDTNNKTIAELLAQAEATKKTLEAKNKEVADFQKQVEQQKQLRERDREQQQVQMVTHDLATKLVLTSEENVVEHIKDDAHKKETKELKDSLAKANKTIEQELQHVSQLQHELDDAAESNKSLTHKVHEDEELLQQARGVSPQREMELSYTIDTLQKQLKEQSSQAAEHSQRGSALSTRVAELEEQLEKSKSDTQKAVEKFNELMQLYNDHKKKSKSEYDALKKQHIASLESVTRAIEGQDPSQIPTSAVPAATESETPHSPHHHVKFADLKPQPEENFDDPLLQRIAADVKSLTEHMHEVEDQLKHELEVEGEVLAKDKPLEAEIVSLKAEIERLKGERNQAQSAAVQGKEAERNLETKLNNEKDGKLASMKQKWEAGDAIGKANEAKVAELTSKLADVSKQYESLQTTHTQLQAQLKSVTEELEQTTKIKSQLDEENKQLHETMASLPSPEAIASLQASSPPMLQQYLGEIAALEGELSKAKVSAEGMQLTLQQKNDELLRVVHTLKCTIDARDAVIADLDRQLEIQSRNAHDAEGQELVLLEQVSELTQQRDTAITACEVLKTHISSLASQLSGVEVSQDENDVEMSLRNTCTKIAEQETGVTMLQEHLDNVSRVHDGLVGTIEGLQRDIRNRDSSIQQLQQQNSLLQQSQQQRDASSKLSPEMAAALAESELLTTAPAADTGSPESDSRLYLITIKDLQEQVNESKALLLSELGQKQRELEKARENMAALNNQIADLRAGKPDAIASKVKNIKDAIISRLAVEMAARVETTAVTNLSRPGTGDANAAASASSSLKYNIPTPTPTPATTSRLPPASSQQAAQILVINAYAEATEMTNNMANTFSSTLSSEGYNGGPPPLVPVSSSSVLSYEEEDEIFHPSRVLPKIGARKPRPASTQLSPGGTMTTTDPKNSSGELPANPAAQLIEVSIEASGRLASPNLEEAIRSYYTPQKKIGDRKRGNASVEGARNRAQAIAYTDGQYDTTAAKLAGPGVRGARSKDAQDREFRTNNTAQSEFSLEDVTKYCDDEIAKENAKSQQFIQSLAGKNTEIVELRTELYNVQQALSAARGEIVVKIVQINNLDSKCAALQQELSEQKQLLVFANDKIRSVEIHREQTEFQKQKAEDKAQEGLRMARKCSELEGQLFDAHRALKIHYTELERTKASLQEAVANANAKYRVKFLGANEKVRRGVRNLQVCAQTVQ